MAEIKHMHALWDSKVVQYNFIHVLQYILDLIALVEKLSWFLINLQMNTVMFITFI